MQPYAAPVATEPDVQTQGELDRAGGLIPLGHVGWAYRGREEFLARVGEYVRDGFAQGQQIRYVGAGGVGVLRREFGVLPGAAQALEAGRAAVVPVEEFVAFAAAGETIDVEATLGMRLREVEEALASGCTGLRIVCDATTLVRTAEQRAAHARMEHLADRCTHVLPVTALCGFDRTVLGAAALEAVCLHPYVNRGAGLFRLYAGPDGELALAGELDASCVERFATVLDRVAPLFEPDACVVDARALTFLDHRGLLCLDRALVRHGVRATLRTANPAVPRLAGLLDLARLRVELAA